MAESNWVRCFHRRPEATGRLVCFPHAGGSASYFYAFSELLGPDVELLAVQYPGRQDRSAEKNAESISELADAVFEALSGTLDGPFSFFGHSMGSVVAFEVSRRFQQRTEMAPGLLFASGYPAPSRLRGGTVHRRDGAGLLAELRLLGGIDPRWLDDPDVLAVVLPPLRADYHAIETHPRTAERLHGTPITMFTGDADPHTTLEEGRAWADATTGPFAYQVFRGGHFYLDDRLPELARLVSDAVGRPAR
ncbi:thioesterase II family protein [Streptomyces geranii]|uniref:thioesterase II family protein n=1 Tax=Streptomyces geranii TaxID=2058923 RepID=UPI000D0434E6|nr:alpha/beta fold hydrolase [Streptomyces geranii]